MGVDPGTNVLGYAVIEALGRKQVRLLTLNVLNLPAGDSPYDKLKQIYDCIQQVIAQYAPTEMAIEAPFYGKNVQSMLKLGRAQGVAIASAMAKGLSVEEYQPRKVKQSVTGRGNASKEQVAAMLSVQMGIANGAHALDATDALAVALCHFYQNDTGNGGGSGKNKRYSNWGDYLRDNPEKK